MCGRVPDEHAGGRGHVDAVAHGANVFHDVVGQTVAHGDGIHPVVGRVVPATDATVGGDVKHIARLGESVDDVGREAGNEAAVSKLRGERIEHLYAGWAASIARQANDELRVVHVHGVQFAVKRAAHLRDGPCLRVELQHASRRGGDEEVRSLEVQVARHRVAG